MHREQQKKKRKETRWTDRKILRYRYPSQDLSKPIYPVRWLWCLSLSLSVLHLSRYLSMGSHSFTYHSLTCRDLCAALSPGDRDNDRDILANAAIEFA